MGLMEAGTSVRSILVDYSSGRENLIPILQEIQEQEGYLSEEALQALAGEMGISENEIYGVATFYAQFAFEPPPEHMIRVCQGTACHVRGGHQLLHDFEERLHIKAGEKTADRQFGIERVACVGCCALAPVVIVDGKVHAETKLKMVRRILAKLAGKSDGGDA